MAKHIDAAVASVVRRGAKPGSPDDLMARLAAVQVVRDGVDALELAIAREARALTPPVPWIRIAEARGTTAEAAMHRYADRAEASAAPEPDDMRGESLVDAATRLGLTRAVLLTRLRKGEQPGLRLYEGRYRGRLSYRVVAE